MIYFDNFLQQWWKEGCIFMSRDIYDNTNAILLLGDKWIAGERQEVLIASVGCESTRAIKFVQ